MSSEIVKQGEICLTYSIFKHKSHNGFEYDWYLSNGDESYSFFASIEEAVADVERRFG